MLNDTRSDLAGGESHRRGQKPSMCSVWICDGVPLIACFEFNFQVLPKGQLKSTYFRVSGPYLNLLVKPSIFFQVF